MDNENEQMAEQRKRQSIINMTCDLSSPASKYGDWKIAKIYEARLNGEPDPYNADELITKRKEIRDSINATRKELGDDITDNTDEQNELDTGYMRSKEVILKNFVAALMSGDTDLQNALKEELKELDSAYDKQNKEG